jgi:hypothetical protein
MEFFEQVKQTFRRMDGRLTRVEAQLDLMKAEVTGLREDLQGIGGVFASIEAMLIANAAQMADLRLRVEALERKAS